MTKRQLWPAIGYEEQTWVPSANVAWGVDAGPAASSRFYRAALAPAIAGRTPTLSPEVLRAAEEAERALARFDAESGQHIESFAPVLLRSEAASSSQIENLTASARAICSAELGAKRSRNAEEIAANTRAVRAAINLARDLTVDSIREVYRVLMGDQLRHTPGTWRSEPV